jgi:hypothetical protein
VLVMFLSCSRKDYGAVDLLTRGGRSLAALSWPRDMDRWLKALSCAMEVKVLPCRGGRGSSDEGNRLLTLGSGGLLSYSL